eukprot:333544_1
MVVSISKSREFIRWIVNRAFTMCHSMERFVFHNIKYHSMDLPELSSYALRSFKAVTTGVSSCACVVVHAICVDRRDSLTMWFQDTILTDSTYTAFFHLIGSLGANNDNVFAANDVYAME